MKILLKTTGYKYLRHAVLNAFVLSRIVLQHIGLAEQTHRVIADANLYRHVALVFAKRGVDDGIGHFNKRTVALYLHGGVGRVVKNALRGAAV